MKRTNSDPPIEQEAKKKTPTKPKKKNSTGSLEQKQDPTTTSPKVESLPFFEDDKLSENSEESNEEWDIILSPANSSENDQNDHIQVQVNPDKKLTEHTFSQFKLSKKLLAALKSENFNFMTQLQHQTLGAALEGKDMVVCAENGSGKRLAMLVPILDYLMKLPPSELSDTVHAIILCPTFNKARAKYNLACWLLKNSPITVTIGLHLKQSNIVICTPEALVRFGTLKNPDLLKNIKICAIDCAEDLSDLIHLQYLKKIFKGSDPAIRQTMLFSTKSFPKKNLPAFFNAITKPEKFTVELINPTVTTFETVNSSILVCPVEQMITQLALVIKEIKGEQSEVKKPLIITPTVHITKFVAKLLATVFPHVSVALDKKVQKENLRYKGKTIIISTDLVCRGINLSACSHVIQFGLPQYADDFLTRFGRQTGSDNSSEGPKQILIISEFEMNNIFPLFVKLPQTPKLMDCHPEDKDYAAIENQMKKRKFPTHHVSRSWKMMILSSVSYPIPELSKELKLQAVQNTCKLFTKVYEKGWAFPPMKPPQSLLRKFSENVEEDFPFTNQLEQLEQQEQEPQPQPEPEPEPQQLKKKKNKKKKKQEQETQPEPEPEPQQLKKKKKQEQEKQQEQETQSEPQPEPQQLKKKKKKKKSSKTKESKDTTEN